MHSNGKNKKRTAKGLRPVGDSVADTTKKVAGKKGAQFGQMLINWRQIAGDETSRKTVPIKLVFPQDKNGKATLHLSVRSSDSLQVQQNSAQLIDRVNRFFGYQAVDRVKLVHMPPPLPHLKNKKKPGMVQLSSQQKTALDNQLSELEDDNLREALHAFGEEMMKSKNQSS